MTVDPPQKSPSAVDTSSEDDIDDDETPIMRGSYNDEDDLELQPTEQLDDDFDATYLDTMTGVSTLTTSFDPAGIGVVHDDSYYYHLYEEQKQQSDDENEESGADLDQHRAQREQGDDKKHEPSNTTATAEGDKGSATGSNTNDRPPSLVANDLEPNERRQRWFRHQARREWGLVVCLLVACIVVSAVIGVVVPRLKRRSGD